MQCFPAGSGDEDMTGGTDPTGLDGNGYAGAFPAPFGMVKTGSSEMETLQSYVCLQSCFVSPVAGGRAQMWVAGLGDTWGEG